MKLIHCADIHLDSRMESNLSAEQARERNREICGTFSKMVAYAKENNVSVVLIAGDLFDTERVSAGTGDYVMDVIRNAPDIDFLYLKGNHDESRRVLTGRELPQNLKMFSDRWTYYRYGFLTVAGVELSGDNYESLYGDLNLSGETTNLVMMHGQVASGPGEGLVCIPALRGKNIDYLALGHIHKYEKKELDPDSSYCYCGCPEGRGFDECGAKGFVLIDAEEHHIETEFIPFAGRELHEIPVDITDKNTVSEILQEMEQAAATVPEKDLIRFVLQGTYTLTTQKDFDFLLQPFRERYYFAGIKDESRLQVEKESYENDISLKGEFIRTVMASDLCREDKDRIICAGIQALSGEEISL